MSRARRGGLVIVAGLALGGAVLLAATWRMSPKSQVTHDLPARQVVTFEPAAKAPPTLDAPGELPPSLAPDVGGEQTPALQPDRQGEANPPAASASPLTAYQGSTSAAAPGTSPVAVAPPATTNLDQLRQVSPISSVQATRLPDRNFLILAGALLPCVLHTAMSSATPGYVSCVIPRDILSASGKVVMLEKGTQVLGEYRGGLQQGQSRLFVLWTRAVTPGGVAVTLASPAADPLGRAGFDGARDTHFWARFGGALLLSLVDGAASASTTGARGDIARLPSDTASVALQSSIAIPPTLEKAQGSEVSIFVAQDLDFSAVYGLRPR